MQARPPSDLPHRDPNPPDQRARAGGRERVPWQARRERLRDVSASRSPASLAAPLRVATATVGFRRVISVGGEVDMATVGTFREAVDAVLLSAERDIWIDLSDVGFMDSSGLDVLLHARRMLTRDHRRLALIVPPGPVLRVLEIAGVDALLPVHGDRPSAHRAA